MVQSEVHFRSAPTARHRFYKNLREKIGTRDEVSKLLGIHKRTLERREGGQIKITDEMVSALKWRD